jgi:hypothetical protein
MKAITTGKCGYCKLPTNVAGVSVHHEGEFGNRTCPLAPWTWALVIAHANEKLTEHLPRELVTPREISSWLWTTTDLGAPNGLHLLAKLLA